MNKYWHQRKSRLDRLFGYYEKIDKLEPEMRSHWVRYLVVLVSGFLETSVGNIYTEYARARASTQVSSYVSARLLYAGNMHIDRIEQLIGEVDREWLWALHDHPDFDRIKAAVQSVVANRNRVAHGQDTSVSIVQLKAYYTDIITLLELLHEQCELDIPVGVVMSRRRKRSARQHSEGECE